jgi:hypothetical protein
MKDLIMLTSILTMLFSCENSSFQPNLTKLDSVKHINSNKPEYLSFDNNLKDDSVNVAITTNQVNNDIFTINIDFKLFGGGWILSPLEKDYPYGITKINFLKNEFISPIDSIIEVPNSTYKTDEYFDTPFRVITEHTTITKKMKVNSKNDFIVEAELSFILEPICKPNKITFNIIQKSGIISIQSFYYNF